MPPDWWDENGTPRFCKFAPEHIANIYADEACLILIQCQSCHMEFEVAMSWDKHEMDGNHRVPSLRDRIGCDELEYGDPPNINCCGSGPSEMSNSLDVIQFWERKDGEWQKDHLVYFGRDVENLPEEIDL